MLFVSKDMGASEMSMPLAEAAFDNGHDVTLVLEGLAMERFFKLNTRRLESGKPELPIIFRGTVDFRDNPFMFDPEFVLKEFNPDVVVVTMSSPINLEDKIGAMANTLGTPLVALNDYWGGLTRAKTAKADLMLAIDEVDADAARQHFTHNFKVEVVGNHAIRTLKTLEPSDGIKTKMAELKKRYGTVMLFGGGGADYTTAEINLLAECLKKTSGSWVLIKRYHPKHAERTAPDGKTYREVWDAQLAQFKNQAIDLPTKEGDALAALADLTVSGFSTLMTTAVGSYRNAVSLVTEETRRSLKAQTTMDRYPLSVAGLVPEVYGPCNLTPFFSMNVPKERVDLILKPYDPMFALAEIEKLF